MAILPTIASSSRTSSVTRRKYFRGGNSHGSPHFTTHNLDDPSIASTWNTGVATPSLTSFMISSMGNSLRKSIASASKWIASPKSLVLLLLVLQNSGHTLLTGYTQKTLKQKYIPSTVILLSELVKTIFSYFMIDSKELNHARLVQTSMPMAVPALLYFINNWLSFQALKSLTPAVYSTLAQLKLLTTAIFAVIMLGKQLSVGQWRALTLLTIGSILVQSNPCAQSKEELSAADMMSGSAAMIVYAILSGFAGIYFEKVLKGTKLSLWERNVQLGVFSVITAIISLGNNLQEIRSAGFFGGYTILSFLVVMTSAAGGLLVALVVKYGDNIVKGFATAFAIVLTSVIGYLFMGGDMSINFMAGAANVILSIFIYSDSEPLKRPVSGSLGGAEFSETAKGSQRDSDRDVEHQASPIPVSNSSSALSAGIVMRKGVASVSDTPSPRQKL